MSQPSAVQEKRAHDIRSHVRRAIHQSFTNEDFCGKYKFLQALGKGAYGAVCKAERLKDKKIVAVKKVKVKSRTQFKRLLRELALLRVLRDGSNIANIMDILPPQKDGQNDLDEFTNLCMVLEYTETDLGTLFKGGRPWTQWIVSTVMYQLFLGLHFMHSAEIVHRDLKPANILISSNYRVRICDFGLARSWKKQATPKGKKKQEKLVLNVPKAREPTAFVVTRYYRAPEVILREQQFDSIDKIDIWAAGCIFGECMQMIHSNNPERRRVTPIFPGKSCWPFLPEWKNKTQQPHEDKHDMLTLIFEVLGTPPKKEMARWNMEGYAKYLKNYKYKKPKNIQKIFPGTPANDILLMKKCLALHPLERLSTSECLAHPAFKSVRDETSEVTTKAVGFDFEHLDLSRDEIREKMVEEIYIWNPDLAEKNGFDLARLEAWSPEDHEPEVECRIRKGSELLILEEEKVGRGVFANDELQQTEFEEEDNKEESLSEEKTSPPTVTKKTSTGNLPIPRDLPGRPGLPRKNSRRGGAAPRALATLPTDKQDEIAFVVAKREATLERPSGVEKELINKFKLLETDAKNIRKWLSKDNMVDENKENTPEPQDPRLSQPDLGSSGDLTAPPAKGCCTVM